MSNWLETRTQNAQNLPRVLLSRKEWIDPARQNDDGSPRAVSTKIYYPETLPDGQTAPVILWSHGLGGSADGAGFLARHIAAHGYILVHITHTGTDSSLWEGKPGHPWEVLRETKITRTATLNRYRDISFIRDKLPEWATENPEIGARMDLSHAGISGHSFGAITAQVIAGQAVPDLDGTLISLKDPRFTAGILYSPVPGTAHLNRDQHDDDGPGENPIYTGITLPLLHMTGTQDDAPIGGEPFEHRLIVYNETRHAAKALLTKREGDHMVYNGTRGQLGASPLRDRHEDIIKTVSLAWWDCWLKNDPAAKDWLTGNGITDYLGADATDWRHEGF